MEDEVLIPREEAQRMLDYFNTVAEGPSFNNEAVTRAQNVLTAALAVEEEE